MDLFLMCVLRAVSSHILKTMNEFPLINLVLSHFVCSQPRQSLPVNLYIKQNKEDAEEEQAAVSATHVLCDGADEL